MSLDEFNEELEKFKLDLINSEIYKEYIKADRVNYEWNRFKKSITTCKFL